jgi:anti-sigma regulatory factor (Ser/Thr protein kinase)
MPTIQWIADLKNVPLIRDFFYKFLAERGYSKDNINKICLSLEEIIVNIISYAFPEDKNDEIMIEILEKDANLTIEVIDQGIPFNPIDTKDPDINAPLEERRIGGLGIFFVKQLTDELIYERRENKNILTLVFKKGI